MPNQNPDRDIPGMIFSREGKAAALRDAYQEIAAEVESLAQLAGGTDPDDDLSDAIAFLARAMSSLTNARRVALQEWAADGGDACFTEAELDKLLGALGKIAREEQTTAAAIPDFETVMAEKYEPESGVEPPPLCRCGAPATYVETYDIFLCGMRKTPADETPGRLYGRMGYEKGAPAPACGVGSEAWQKNDIDETEFGSAEEPTDGAL